MREESARYWASASAGILPRYHYSLGRETLPRVTVVDRICIAAGASPFPIEELESPQSGDRKANMPLRHPHHRPDGFLTNLGFARHAVGAGGDSSVHELHASGKLPLEEPWFGCHSQSRQIDIHVVFPFESGDVLSA